MIKKALIKSYADAAAVFAKARKPERGKPLDSLFRLMREKNERGDIYHLCWGTPRKLMATIHPDNTAEIYMPKGIPWYVFGRTLPTIIPFVATYSRKKGASAVIHTRVLSDFSSWPKEDTHEHYPGIRFNMETGECISTKPPPPAVNKDKRKEWLRDLRVFKKQFALRAKLGVIDGLIKQEADKGNPRWAMNVTWGTNHTAVIFSDMKRGAPSTELLQLIVRHTFASVYHFPNVDSVHNSFNRVLAKLSTDLRNLYGVFDETETN